MIAPPIHYSTANTETVTDLVRDHIGETSVWATTAFTSAVEHLNNLANLRFDVDYDAPVFIDVPGPSINPVKPSSPNVGDISFTPVTFDGIAPEIPTFNITNFTPPEYAEKDYGIAIPAAPEVTWPTFTKEAPVILDRIIPTVPATELPPVPQITDIVIPSPPVYNSPEFTAEVPVADLTLPEINFNWGESQYDSELKTKLGDTLFDNLVNGGTGLSEETEQAIYTRAKSRMQEEEQKMVDEVSDDIAQRGFDLPPGALMVAGMEVENKILRSREDLNNDILINQSKLAQENTHFIITQAANLENILISYHSNTQARALDAAKYTVAATIQIHQLKLENYKAKLSAYQTLAQVYQIRVQAEIAKAEFYKAQVEATKTSVAVQQLYIQAYLGQLEAVKATLETYKLQMEGARLTASIDKLKLDGYATEVGAYATKVNASTQRYEGYKAQLAGEEIKMNMYETDVKAFAAQASAYHIKTQGEVAKAEAQLNLIRMHAAVYEQAIEKYKADVGKSVSEADVEAKIAGLNIDVYQAEANNYNAELTSTVDLFRGRVAEMQANADISVKSADLAIRAALGEYELAVEVSKGVASVAGQLAAAAAGAINASLHASSSESRSDSYSRGVATNYNLSGSESESFIEEHIYSYSN